MKIFKMMCILFSLASFSQSQAEDYTKINDYVNNLNTEIKSDVNEPYRIYQIYHKLYEIKKITTKCVAQEDQIINQYEDEARNLLDINYLKQGIDEKNKYLNMLKFHQETKKFCQHINTKINFYNQKISELSRMYFIKSLFTKNQISKASFIYIFKFNISGQTLGFLKDNFVEQSNIFLNLHALLISLMIFLFLKVIGHFKFNKIKFFNELNTKRYLVAVCVYVIFSPFQFLTLLGLFSNFVFDELLLNLLRIKIVIMMILVFIYYIYRHYTYKLLFKDCLQLLIYTVLWFGLIYSSVDLLLLKLSNSPHYLLLSKKYAVILLLQPMIFIIMNWMFIKILHFKKNKRKYLYVLYLFCVLNFIMGIIFFINIAILIDFLIIINCIFLSWFHMIYNTTNKLMDGLNDSSSIFNHILYKIFHEQKKTALFNIKSLIYVFYFLSLMFLLMLLIGIDFWPLLEQTVSPIAKEIFFVYQYNNLSLSIVDFFKAITLLFFLNLCNYALSNYSAHQLFKDAFASSNSCIFFTWVGYIITAIIILNSFNYKFQDIVILLSGIGFGLIFSLRNIFSSIFSGLVLFINRPFKCGDLIEIGNVSGYISKGYVKKISLMETTIETSYNNVLILPNEFVAASVIQNYTYEDKGFQKVRIQYLIKNLDLSLEYEIKNMIEHLLHKTDYLFEDKNHPITQLLSVYAEPVDSYCLSIVFCLNTQIDIEKELNKINRLIYSKLKDMKLDVHFENVFFK